MPYKDRQKRREYQRRWMRRKRGGLLTRTTTPLSDEEKHRRKANYNREYRNRKRALIKTMLGENCVICDGDSTILVHKKDGMKHPKILNLGLSSLTQTFSNNEYVLLCRPCHNGVHWCMDKLQMGWAKIEKRVRDVVVA